MSLAQLQIHNVRNIISARLELHPKLNFIFGDNGSGKTSLLEAIYLLASGHSFRTREILPLVSNGEDGLTVFARTEDEQSVSIKKSHALPTQVRLNTLPCQSSSELARFLPCQVFYQDIFQIIDAGPSVRRSVIDWGLFHVKQDYHSLWKNYKRALKQRNSLLKQNSSSQQLHPWNKALADFAEQLHVAREDYFLRLAPEFQTILQQLTQVSCSLQYYKGWDRRETGKSLQTILEDSYATDKLRQFTQYGAHQADLIVRSDDFKAKDFLSRGQQKIVLFALKLAQAKFTPKPCIYLADDLCSEFDRGHIELLLKLFGHTNGQFFITSTHPSPFFMSAQIDAKVFSVSAGKIS